MLNIAGNFASLKTVKLTDNLFFLLVAGAALLLRLIWPEDMEWKFDEQEMFRLAGEAVQNGLPAVGMPSGGGLPNAGFSIWPFALFYSLHPSPIFMAWCVQLLNILAIALMVFCASRYAEENRRILFYGLASFAVSLMPVLFARKIWAQDLMPVFIALMWLCYEYRHKWYCLPLMGLSMTFAGQLHLSGFYYGAGLFAAMLLFKRVSFKMSLLIVSGAAVGLIPAMTWIETALQQGGGISHFFNIVKFEFWLRCLTDVPGFNAYYSAENDIQNFARFPFNAFVVPIVATVITLLILFATYGYLKNNTFKFQASNPLHFLLIAFVMIPGLLMTLSGIPIRSHYLIGAYPFLCMALLNILLKWGVKQARMLIGLQALFTLLFLLFVHQQQEVKGDYGKTYGRQMEEAQKNTTPKSDLP